MQGKNRTWILTALGKDQPGIVAAVTKALYELGCNLEDSAMTRLGGEFTIMLSFSAPPEVSQSRIGPAFRALSRRLRLTVNLRVLTDAERAPKRVEPPYLISVYGADHPGIVYKVSSLLATLGVNISDVSTHRTPGRASSAIYLMVLEVELPPRLTVQRLDQQLQTLAKSVGVHVNLRSAETSVL